MQMPDIATDDFIDRLMSSYREFDAESIDRVIEFYTEEVLFIDPIERIEGKQALSDYFQSLAENLIYCKFDFSNWVKGVDADGRNSAVLFWTMSFAHPKLNGGKGATLAGCSHLIYDSRIHYQRDYYDLGEMLYERLPLLGGVIRWLKRRMGQS